MPDSDLLRPDQWLTVVKILLWGFGLLATVLGFFLHSYLKKIDCLCTDVKDMQLYIAANKESKEAMRIQFEKLEKRVEGLHFIPTNRGL